MSCAAVVLIVTMGSYGALVRFLNSLQTNMYSFASSVSASMHRNRYPKTGFANSNSDRIKNINI